MGHDRSWGWGWGWGWGGLVMTWPEPGSGISANLAESLISIKVKNVARPGLLAVGSICPNTKEEEKEQQEEDQRAKPQTAKPQSPPNPPIRIHCTNGNYAYLTGAVLWGQSILYLESTASYHACRSEAYISSSGSDL